MSVISLEVVKRRLKATHGFDDADLQQALDGAEDEALRFLNRTQLPTLPQDYPDSDAYSEDAPSSEDPVAPSVVEGVLLLVMASIEALSPQEIEGYRKAAETKLQPYRVGMGV